MRTRRVFLIAAACLALLVAGILLLLRDDEPRYQGRSLSRWLEMSERPGRSQTQASEEAQAALRHFGSNAIPNLLTWIAYEPSKQGYEFRLSLQKLPAVLRPSLVTQGEIRSAMSMYAFGMIGPDARYAVPELQRLAGTSTNIACLGRCIHALFLISPEGQSALLDIVANTNSSAFSRGYSMAIFGRINPDEAAAIPRWIPVVVECLRDQQMDVATSAASALGHPWTSPSVAVPALTAALSDPRAQVRGRAAFALASFREQASPALPALNRLLIDPDAEVRSHAQHAINQIKGPTQSE